MTYHETEATINGVLYKVGDVVRITNMQAFSDCVIAGFGYDKDKIYTKVFRPYLYVSNAGTTCATALVGYETIEALSESTLKDWITKIGSGRTT